MSRSHDPEGVIHASNVLLLFIYLSNGHIIRIWVMSGGDEGGNVVKGTGRVKNDETGRAGGGDGYREGG